MVSGHLTPKIVLRQMVQKDLKSIDRRRCTSPCLIALEKDIFSMEKEREVNKRTHGAEVLSQSCKP
jgi:hypothetical protein